ncbi:MAG: hypothetical protein LUC22_03965 [Prevotella sp.]|nr:hypothetical protein [Prevotella sp.]
MQAYYDKEPSRLQADKNGRYRYRYDIEKSERQGDETAEQTEQWGCKEVIVFAPLSANKILQAVLVSEYDTDREQKLVNDYNAAMLGLLDTDEAAQKIEAYKEFLARRATLKADVDAVCKENNIKNG